MQTPMGYQSTCLIFKKAVSNTFYSAMLQLVSNPKSAFVRGVGQILHILNDQFGIALAARQPNNWESILFHRSACFLLKLNLGSHDLTKIFKEGKP